MGVASASQSLSTIKLSLLLLLLLAALHIYSSRIGNPWIISTTNSTNKVTVGVIHNEEQICPPEPIVYTLQCSTTDDAQTCPDDYPKRPSFRQTNKITCPSYFRWIHEDLKPWNATGITKDMVDRAKTTAHFRLVILQGKIFVETFRKSIQSRDIFTIWGFVQILRMYPGMVPDVELMFDCDDRPVVPAEKYGISGNEGGPPPVFRYCSDRRSLDIVFPDWSFWGWPEINIKPWHLLVGELKRGNERVKWVDREPYAYWKGNPFVAETRKDLLTCNVTKEKDWNARLFIQDWIQESRQGFRKSGLASQCMHRFKIYIEGFAWSVSQKYILACNSLTLIVKTKFHDFFTRGMEPLLHYWPIRDEGKCRSIKYAVDWGNNHSKEAAAIGMAGSDFVLNQVKMEHVYDYMYHLLCEYAKLQRFKPEIPVGGVEVCSETMACNTTGMRREFMAESLISFPSSSSPCRMPAYDSHVLSAFFKKNMDTISKVERWEDDSLR